MIKHVCKVRHLLYGAIMNLSLPFIGNFFEHVIIQNVISVAPPCNNKLVAELTGCYKRDNHSREGFHF